MPKGRKNGCPVNVKDWLIYIQDKAQVVETWVRIYGIEKINRKNSSTTEDSSAKTDLWEEPYVTKRNSTITLEGKPIVDMGTGLPDEGQDMLDSYGEMGGCDGELTLKLIDPYGHTVVADFIITDSSTDSDDSDNTVSWDLKQVGEPETLPYAQMSSVTLQKPGESSGTWADAGSSIAMTAGDSPMVLKCVFNPQNASNKRFRVNVSGRKYVSVSNITDDTFTITPMAAGTATVTVTTMNGNKQDSVSIVVSAAS